MFGGSEAPMPSSIPSEALHKWAAASAGPAIGHQVREHFKTPRNAAWILELLKQRQRFRCLRARQAVVFSHHAAGRGCQKQNAETPRFAGTPTHVDRFIVELLRAIVIAVRPSDVAKHPEERSAMFCGSAACAGGVSRRERTRDSLVVRRRVQGRSDSE